MEAINPLYSVNSGACSPLLKNHRIWLSIALLFVTLPTSGNNAGALELTSHSLLLPFLNQKGPIISLSGGFWYAGVVATRAVPAWSLGTTGCAGAIEPLELVLLGLHRHGLASRSPPH